MAQIELSLEFGLTTNMAYFQALQKYFINSILTLESWEPSQLKTVPPDLEFQGVTLDTWPYWQPDTPLILQWGARR